MPLSVGAGMALAGGLSALGGIGSALLSRPASAGGIDVNEQMIYNRLSSALARDLQREDRIWQSQQFKNFAKNMGVSRYALLGNAPQAGPVAFAQPKTQSRGARYFPNLGQDIGRGISSYIQAKQLESTTKVNDAQANLLNTQAKAIQQSQLPKDQQAIQEFNLPSDYASYDKQLKDRGVEMGEAPTLMRSGAVRLYPGQQLQDLVSEDSVAWTTYYYDKLRYAKRLATDPSFRQDQKNELEWRLGRPVYLHTHKLPWVETPVAYWSIVEPKERVIRRKIDDRALTRTRRWYNQ